MLARQLLLHSMLQLASTEQCLGFAANAIMRPGADAVVAMECIAMECINMMMMMMTLLTWLCYVLCVWLPPSSQW
jgi:hypothetical protein